MDNNISIAGNLMKIDFDCHFMPVVKEKSSRGYLKWGSFNDHPNYLLNLYKRNAYHGAIIKAKADHVYGKGLCYDASNLTIAQQAVYDNFLSRANRFEDWNSLFRKNTMPFEIFDGVAIQFIYGLNGKITDCYNLEFSKLRCSPDGKTIFYCDAWIDELGNENANAHKHDSYKEYPVFNPNIRTGTQIMYYKTEVMTPYEFGNIYPEPNYIQICQDIETDIEITNFHYSNMKNGMFAAAMLSLFNGEPSEEEKKKYKKMFDAKYKGTSKTGSLLFNFVDKGGQEAKLTTLTQSDLDKMFQEVGKRLQQNILTGHRIDPALASIFSDTQVIGDNTIYLQKYERWIKSYIEHRQEIHLDIIKTIASVNGIDLSLLEVKPKAPANVDLPYDANFLLNLFDANTLKKHYAKQLGIEIQDEETDVEGGQLVPEQQVNEHIKKLSGRDWTHIKRLIREVSNGKTTREAAAMMLKRAYGMTDEDVNVLFATPESNFSKFDKLVDMTSYVLELFEKAAIDEEEGEILSEEFVSFKNSTEAFNHEFLVKQKFRDLIPSEKNSILDIIKGNPLIKPELIAKQLGLEITEVTTAINDLSISGLIEGTIGSLSITDKGNSKDIPPVETEVYTVYKYVTRPDVPSVETTSRPFCKKMLAMTRNGKVWTRDALDDLTNVFGEDAWVYRGGFYTNPDTGETTPYCRHLWKSITKSRVKKK